MFLDEVGEMSPRMQALLLRFLETGEVQRVGSDGSPTMVDVRVIAATNRDLKAMVLQGSFREDLLYRLNVTRIAVPPCGSGRKTWPRSSSWCWPPRGGRWRLAMRPCWRWRPTTGPATSGSSRTSCRRWRRSPRPTGSGVEDLPPQIASLKSGPLYSKRERRRRVADDLYEQLAAGSCRFWEDIRPLLLNRDITRADLRQLIGLGLAASGGSYRGLLTQFGMGQGDYKRLLNFLAAHDCSVDHTEFRAAPRALRRGPRAPDAAAS